MDNERSKPNVLIRSYHSADGPACRQLWVELTEWHRHIYRSPDIGGSDLGAQIDQHLAQVGPENLWVAELAGQVVGLTGLIPGEGEAELEPFVVSASFRGRGIGRQLAVKIKTVARDRGFRHLSVRPVGRNREAIRFFHDAGFEILGHIELFMELSPADEERWRSGERLAGREFLI